MRQYLQRDIKTKSLAFIFINRSIYIRKLRKLSGSHTHTQLHFQSSSFPIRMRASMQMFMHSSRAQRLTTALWRPLHPYGTSPSRVMAATYTARHTRMKRACGTIRLSANAHLWTCAFKRWDACAHHRRCKNCANVIASNVVPHMCATRARYLHIHTHV